MSRCYICDTYIENPQIDPRDGQLKPCTTCEDAIYEDLRDGADDDFIAYIDDFETDDPSTL